MYFCDTLAYQCPRTTRNSRCIKEKKTIKLAISYLINTPDASIPIYSNIRQGLLFLKIIRDDMVNKFHFDYDDVVIDKDDGTLQILIDGNVRMLVVKWR